MKGGHMGSVFRPKYKNKDGTVQESQVWWIKYYRDGRPHRESSGSVKVGVARDLLKEREGDSVKGIPITPKMGASNGTINREFTILKRAFSLGVKSTPPK